MVLLLSACQDKAPMPDAAYAPYVTAFTTGHVPATDPILVRLAEDIRYNDTTNATLQRLFKSDPAVAGTVTWQDERTLAFRPAERLKQNTTYTVVFQLGLVAQVPEDLHEFRFGLTTYRQGINARMDDMRSISLTDLAWQQVVIGVSTSDRAASDELEDCFSATQEGRPLRMQWEHEPDGRYHRFTVDSVKRGELASRVILEWDATAIDSDDADSLHVIISSINDLRLISASTTSGAEPSAILLFSDPLSAEQDITGLAGISGVDDVRLSVDGNRLLLHPQERLTGTYEGFVSQGITNILGRRLGKDITVPLLFEEVKPAVRLTGKGVILPSTSGLLFPFQAVNLNAVKVRIIRIHEANVAQFLQVNEMDGQRELARVGRPIAHAVVPLRTKDAPDPGVWNDFYIDLEKYIKAEPGAIYRVELSFEQEHAAYPCGDKNTAPLIEHTLLQEEDEWDSYEDRYYYDDYYYYEDYDHNERDDPCSPSYYGRRHTVARNILASDLGIIAKKGENGELFVAVTDLRSTAPLSGVSIELLDLQRQRLARVITDGNGVCTIPAAAHRPFLLVANKGGQRGYLKLDDGTSLSLSEFDVGGASVQKGLKGFIYGERGVWRPGDSLYLAFILQDERHTLPKDHPVIMELTDPRGRLVQRLVRTQGVNGTYDLRTATSPDAPTGLWGARVIVGGTAFHRSLRIETVKPNRMKVMLDAGGERITLTSGRRLKLQANWLHGAPAGNAKARVTLDLTGTDAAFKGYEAYTFNDLRTSVSGRERIVFDGVLDANGHAEFPLDLELNERAPAAVRANFVSRVFEAGGDASMDRYTTTVLPYSAYVGIKEPKVISPWGTLVTDTTYIFPVVALDAEGRSQAGRRLKAQIYKLSYSWWWDGNVDGLSNYISSPSVELVSEQELTSDPSGRANIRFRVDRPQWGRFAVRIMDASSGHSAAMQVYVDWPGWEGRSRRQQPEEAAMLTFNSDKDEYAVGDMAELTIPSSGKGRALVSLESGTRVLEAVWVDMTDKETRFRFPITAGMAPNIYAHVSVVQPHDRTMNDLPIRLYGVIPIHVNDPTTHLVPRIAMNKEIRTDVPFTVAVSEKEGKAMTYTLAIVDEGLLDLTRFKTPDPWQHFYAREALGVRTWDMYDHVIGAFGRRVERILAMGGSDAVAPADAARAQRFRPVVRHVGPFRLKANGKAEHSFTISNYVGSVRVMVVASDGEKAYGHAENTVPVRKPLMLIATLPRVLGPGETVDLPVTVFAMDEKVKKVNVSVEASDPVRFEGPSTKEITFDGTGEQVVVFKARVQEAVGVARFTVKATGAGEKATERLELQVRAPNLPATEVSGTLIPAGEEWSATPVPLGSKGTNSAYVEISGFPPIDLGRRLKYLIDYPHGCLEQTLSKAFPQLYIADVMEMDQRTGNDMRRNVEAAVRRLQAFQRSDGGFNYWPGGDHYDAWSSTQAGHFLVEAADKGFVIPSAMRNNWLSATRRAARDWTLGTDRHWTAERSRMLQAYRLYVLALARSPEMGAMNRLYARTDLRAQEKWTLAAAYALAGQKDAARKMVKDLTTEVSPYNELSYTYGSDLRDGSLIVLALLAMEDANGAGTVVQRIARKLGEDRWYSTQSTAFGLMAVSRYAALGGLSGKMSFAITTGGDTRNVFSEHPVHRKDLPAPDGKASVAIRNTGSAPLYVRLVRSGTPPAGNEAAYANGITMNVQYTLMDGTPLDPARVQQGTDLIATVRIHNPGTEGDLNELALTRIFPSGWEIRNTRMEGSEATLTQDMAEYTDIRDDRVMTYFDLYRGRTVTYKVLLNASYTGRYYLPPPVCEAMYDATINARGEGKWVDVVPAGGGNLP